MQYYELRDFYEAANIITLCAAARNSQLTHRWEFLPSEIKQTSYSAAFRCGARVQVSNTRQSNTGGHKAQVSELLKCAFVFKGMQNRLRKT